MIKVIIFIEEEFKENFEYWNNLRQGNSRFLLNNINNDSLIQLFMNMNFKYLIKSFSENKEEQYL